ncbi:uncharacterized protein LOC135390519 [Ornithodoros turicata]|uniref:uncharacterized protein LOC135390519 n=1 Tax=Ornithodoros turicata TaxID=34597 RepID=UPI00313A0126
MPVTIPVFVAAFFFSIIHFSVLSASGDASAVSCGGTFDLNSETHSVLIQQLISNEEDIEECRFRFRSSAKLLLIAYDNTAMKDNAIPGFPVNVYDTLLVEDGTVPVMSLSGHHETTLVPLLSTEALIVYKPLYGGSPYKITVNWTVSVTEKVSGTSKASLTLSDNIPTRYGVLFNDNIPYGTYDVDIIANRGGIVDISCLAPDNATCNYSLSTVDGSDASPKDGGKCSLSAGVATTVSFQPQPYGVLSVTWPFDFEPSRGPGRQLGGQEATEGPRDDSGDDAAIDQAYLAVLGIGSTKRPAGTGVAEGSRDSDVGSERAETANYDWSMPLSTDSISSPRIPAGNIISSDSFGYGSSESPMDGWMDGPIAVGDNDVDSAAALATSSQVTGDESANGNPSPADHIGGVVAVSFGGDDTRPNGEYAPAEAGVFFTDANDEREDDQKNGVWDRVQGWIDDAWKRTALSVMWLNAWLKAHLYQ